MKKSTAKAIKIAAFVNFNFWRLDDSKSIERTTCIKGQNWPPLEMVYLFIF